MSRSSPFGKKSSVGGPKQPQPKSLLELVMPKDKIDHKQAIDYLKRLLDAQKRVGNPNDDIGAIFDKI